MLFERPSLERLRRLASSLGLALVVLSPLFFVRALEDAYVLPQRLLALLGLLLAWLALEPSPLDRSALFLAALAFFWWRWICQILSARTGETWPWVVTQLPSLGALCLAAHAGRDQLWAQRAWRWGALGVLLASAYALILLWGWDPFEQGAVDMGFLQRAHGSLGNPDFLAGFLVLAVPGLTLAWLRPGRWAGARLAAWGLVVLTLLLTQVRGAWLAAGISLALSLFAARALISGRRLLILGGLLSALVVGLSVPSRLNVPGQSPWARLSSSFHGDGAWAGRRFMASVAWDMVEQHPWVGSGPGHFQEDYLIQQGHRLSLPEGHAEPYRFTADIHDDWLQTLADSGWPGLFLLLAVLGLALRAAAARRSIQGAALLGLLVAFSVHGLFHFPLSIQASSLFFWGSIGLLAAEDEREPKGSAWPWALWAFPLLLGILTVAHQGLASAALNTGSVLKEKGQTALAQSFFQRATQLWPEDVRAWMRLGLTQDALGDGEGAIHSFSKATELSRGLPEAWADLGLALGKAQDLPLAQAAEEQALSLNPRSAETWGNLAKIREMQGDPAGALRNAMAGLAQAGPNATLYFDLGALYLDQGQRQEAKRAFDECLRLDPSNAIAAHWSKELQHAR